MPGPQPTTDQILEERADLETMADSNKKTLDEYADQALASVKRDLEDERDIKFDMVFDATADEYFVDEDGDARNDDRIKKMITLFIVSLVFKDFSNDVENGYWLIHRAYNDEYMRLMTTAKLDIDRNEDGTVDSQTTGQKFMRR